MENQVQNKGREAFIKGVPEELEKAVTLVRDNWTYARKLGYVTSGMRTEYVGPEVYWFVKALVVGVNWGAQIICEGRKDGRGTL